MKLEVNVALDDGGVGHNVQFSQYKVCRCEGGDAVHLNLKVRLAVAVYVALDDDIGAARLVMQLALGLVEFLRVDEGEALVARAAARVDVGEVDLVELNGLKVGDDVALGADGAFEGPIEIEDVGIVA